MGLIVRGTKAGTGTTAFGSTTALSSEVNADFDTAYTLLNGNIENANIKSNAGILASKLSLSTISQNIANTGTLTNTGNVTITGDVSITGNTNMVGTLTCDSLQLTGATVITNFLDEDDMASDSAVALPTQQSVKAYVDNNNGGSFKVGTLTRDMTASSGDVAYTGVGFVPKAIIFCGAKASSASGFSMYMGLSDGSTETTLQQNADAPTQPYIYSTSTHSISMFESGTQYQIATTKSFDADGFTLTWTKGGTPSANTVTICYMAMR